MSGGIKKYQGVFRVYFVSETAQVELTSGRVEAPAVKLKSANDPRETIAEWELGADRPKRLLKSMPASPPVL